MENRLLDLTEQLLSLNEEAYHYYMNTTKQAEHDADFYQTVKPFSDRLLPLAEEWKEQSFTFIETRAPKYLHKQQVEDAFENLQFVAVFAFQKDTKERRFTGLVRSIQYTLDIVKDRLDQENL
ncbi:hypothetical protein A374_03644 [Fictibacillus macauensis ZFHKF-1]|uniref:DUF1798 family protein n=1 Tax=Fictibacillus macauensis ZFHKF-1 TaxID=1196324 RepID=I8UII4_9BACL|nr:YppE family protein [Fictibacillus macauensis]EIT86633.1 hypothetical protein A374_03644 [Fictibacillus macauensis ZFHKF-1]